MLRKTIRDGSIKLFIIRILFLFYLSSSYLTATHIHDDGEDHFDACEVCVIVKHFHSADIPNEHIIISPLEYNHDEIRCHHISLVTHICKGFYSTAPPLHSSTI